MLNKSVLYLLFVALALLASPGLVPPPVAAQDFLVVDDNGPPSCAPVLPSNIYTTITQALAVANSGDTIYVCDGDYTDHAMYIVSFNELTITGPDDGVATIQASDWVFSIQNSQQIVIEGLNLDVQTNTSAPFDIRTSQSVFIQHNDIRSPISPAVVAADSQYVQVLSNNIHDSNEGVKLGNAGSCDNCMVSGNTVNVTGDWAINVYGNNGNITSNVVVGGSVSGYGDNLSVAANQITGPMSGSNALLGVAAVGNNHVGVTDNTLSDSAGYGLKVDVGPSGGSVTIARNTFTNIATPIHLVAWSPGDPLVATIGGSQADANTFAHSGGSLGDAAQLLSLADVTMDVNAEYNNWGLCTAAEIEQEIHHQVDDPALGRVDFEPFILPSSCSAATPTPTPGGRVVTIPPGKWANFVWTGDNSPQDVADCFGAGKISVMYRLDAASGSFQRWIRGRPELSNLGQVAQYDALLALNSSGQQASCTPPSVMLLGRTVTIPAGRWANFAWSGNVTLAPQEVADCFAGGNISVMYRLDAASGSFQRWIRGRPELTNMGNVAPFDAILGLNAGSQDGSCDIPIMVT